MTWLPPFSDAAVFPRVPWIVALTFVLSFTLPAATRKCQSQTQPVRLDHAALKESSGVAVSYTDENLLWTHNDSGDGPRLYAFRRDGTFVAQVELMGVEAIDWEDICSFHRDGRDFLAVGDIGDNSANRETVSIYVLEEPKLARASISPQTVQITRFQRIEVEYSEGPVNCEALAYDSTRDSFLLATKELIRSRLYECDASAGSKGDRKVAANVVTTLGIPLVTGADISRDGRRLALVTYGPGCLIERKPNQSWESAKRGLRPLRFPPRKQGESLCFDHSGKHLLLTSEFAPTPLWKVSIEQAVKKH